MVLVTLASHEISVLNFFLSTIISRTTSKSWTQLNFHFVSWFFCGRGASLFLFDYFLRVASRISIYFLSVFSFFFKSRNWNKTRKSKSQLSFILSHREPPLQSDFQFNAENGLKMWGEGIVVFGSASLGLPLIDYFLFYWNHKISFQQGLSPSISVFPGPIHNSLAGWTLNNGIMATMRWRCTLQTFRTSTYIPLSTRAIQIVDPYSHKKRERKRIWIFNSVSM